MNRVEATPVVATDLLVKNPATYFKRYVARLNAAMSRIAPEELDSLVDFIRQAQCSQNTVFIIGNGGSAAASSHWATDLGKGLHHRKDMGVKALSLADNVSWISAAANDLNFESVFSDQLRAHGKEGDLLISISASGNSPNILKAIQQAKSMGITTLSVLGFDGGVAKDTSDHVVHIPTAKGEYGIVEDIQLIINHFLCDYMAGELE